MGSHHIYHNLLQQPQETDIPNDIDATGLGGKLMRLRSLNNYMLIMDTPSKKFKSSDTDGFTGEFFKISKEKIISVLYNFF